MSYVFASIFLIYFGRKDAAREARGFLGLHRDADCVFPLIGVAACNGSQDIWGWLWFLCGITYSGKSLISVFQVLSFRQFVR